jgi:hypothetical protein
MWQIFLQGYTLSTTGDALTSSPHGQTRQKTQITISPQVCSTTMHGNARFSLYRQEDMFVVPLYSGIITTWAPYCCKTTSDDELMKTDDYFVKTKFHLNDSILNEFA